MSPFFPVHPVVGVLVMVWWDMCVMSFIHPHYHPYIDDLKRKRKTLQTHEE